MYVPNWDNVSNRRARCPWTVLVTTGGYGAPSNVWKSTDGNTFTSIQSNLPAFPVYDGAISWVNRDHYVIGTDIGVWASNDGGLSWGEENDLLDRVPTFRVRQRKLYTDDCPVIYLGTHGRGIFRTTTLTPEGCNTTPGILTSVDEPVRVDNQILNFNIFPNPTSDLAKVKVNIQEVGNVEINVFDLPGRVVNQRTFTNMAAGEHILDMDVSDLPAGNYLMSLRVDDQLYESRIFVISR